MKKTYVFDELDNVLAYFDEGVATFSDVISIARAVNKYLIENPHPHDIIDQDV